MKKLFILTISLFFICFLSGCTNKQQIEEVSFWTLQMGDFAPYINNVILKYEAEHPNIKIKWVDVPFSEGEKRTLAAVMTDCPPDLINLNPDFSAILAQKGTLEEVPFGELKNFNQEIIKSLEYNGKIYSIPWYATSAVTIYNKDLFKKTGLNNLPKTYDELNDRAAIIKSKTGAYAYIPTITENDTVIKLLNKYGISDIKDFSSGESIKLFEKYKELYKNGLIPPETITMTHREALEQYMAGKTVFFLGGANFLNMIKENAPKIYIQTDITEQLKGPLGQNDFSLMNFVIPVKAKHKQEALDFCLYLTNEENQLELGKLTNIISTNNNALKDPFYNDYSDLTSKARSISAKQIQKINPQLKQRQNQKELNLLMSTAVQSILLNKIPVKEALENVIKKFED